MSETHMLGVVLWCDDKASKAIIWCEDHGNLAFYTPPNKSALDGASLDAGDLIEFDLTEEEDLRYARNPRVIGQDCYGDLAGTLSRTAPQSTARPVVREPVANSDNVIHFDRHRLTA